MRIVVLHDVFRAALFGLGGVNQVAAFWQSLLAPKLRRLGHALELPAGLGADRPAALDELAAGHGLAHEPGSWFRLFSDPAMLPAVTGILAPLRGFDLVLGWELSPNIMRALSGMRLGFIDASIDSIRFCPDLFLRLRTNAPRYHDALAALEISGDRLRQEAARQSAIADSGGRASVLFAGQMPIDSSLIVGGKLAEPASFIGQIAAGLRGRQLLLKPHPHAAPHADIRALHDAIPDSRITTDPVYALLAAPWLEEVVTLSSSVADEAEMFGKPAMRLITPDGAPERLDGVSRFHRVDAGFLTAAFWDRLLSRRPARAALPEPPAPRNLRQLFRYDWGWRAATPEPGARDIRPGMTVRFASGQPGGAWCCFGWSTPEDWGIWSDGDVATLLVQPQDAPDGLTLRLALTAFVPDASRPPGLEITSRPAGVARRIFLDSPNPPPIDIALPAALCGDGPVEIVLRFRDLSSPADAGLSGDARRLGVGLMEAVTF
jgi:hypothetical protein